MDVKRWTTLAIVLLRFGAAPAADNPALDKQMYDALRDMHNSAVDFYNRQDPGSCYRMFVGGLMVAKPVLAHRPDLQDVIEKGLADAEKLASIPARAQLLHKTIETVREKLKPTTGAMKVPTDAKPPEVPPAKPGDMVKSADAVKPNDGAALGEPPPPSPPAAATLWKRLGGEERVKEIVEKWFTMAIVNDKVNLTRGGKYKFDAAKETSFKETLVAYVSSVANGTVAYTGKSMADAHKDMRITAGEFDAFVTDLRFALERQKVGATEIEELVKKIEATRKDVVGDK